VRSDVRNKEGAFVEKQKVGEYAEKLSKYANLFEEQAINDFVKLGDENKSLAQISSSSTPSYLI
jgi:hypothetical protein